MDSSMPSMDHAGHSGMTGMLGSYSMHREASGTSWQPESSPADGIHSMRGGWMLMLHGFADVVYDHQGGPRGDEKTFAPNMGMVMAQRPAAGGTFGARAMLSLDPVTIGKHGYPLLLQTGEAVDERPLVDRQHPHDLFMELAATYSHHVGRSSSAFLYAGLPGEPALGPPTFMHRFSGIEIPEAPISHHWLDSTHITFGVLTAGITTPRVKLEASAFRGREPDERRFDIERPRLDSFAGRVQWNPRPDWSLQVSAGHLHSPEELEPTTNLWRTTASITLNRPQRDGNWQSTFAWGRNDRTGQDPQDAFLLESTLRRGRHTGLARAEAAQKDELFESAPLNSTIFGVRRLSLGYILDVARARHAVVGMGALGSLVGLPQSLQAFYGGHPVSGMVFLRAALR
jgi:hypothetical protein